MSHIELDINDLTNLSDKIKGIKVKLNNLETTIDSKFGRAKKYELYINGFKKIRKYLEDQVVKMDEMKIKLERYQNEIINIEKTYSDRFNGIVIPNFQSTASNLSVTSSPSYNLGAVSQITEQILEENNNDTVTYQSTSEEKTNSGGLGEWGSLAAAAGIVGAGGLGTAAFIRSKTKEQDDDKKEETKYVTVNHGEQKNNVNKLPFIFDSSAIQQNPTNQPVMPRIPGNMFPHIIDTQQSQSNNNVIGEE